jgi:hypothetical protein
VINKDDNKKRPDALFSGVFDAIIVQKVKTPPEMLLAKPGEDSGEILVFCRTVDLADFFEKRLSDWEKVNSDCCRANSADVFDVFNQIKKIFGFGGVILMKEASFRQLA